MCNFDELKRFEKDLKASEELRRRMDETVLRVKDAGQMKSDGELVTAAAKELGYDIPVAVLEQAQAEAEHLDPAMLEAVAGGQCKLDPCRGIYDWPTIDEEGHDGWCLTGWHCYTVTIHNNTADDEDVKCWSDYQCLWLNK